jgi:hypothetical protein
MLQQLTIPTIPSWNKKYCIILKRLLRLAPLPRCFQQHGRLPLQPVIGTFSNLTEDNNMSVDKDHVKVNLGVDPNDPRRVPATKPNLSDLNKEDPETSPEFQNPVKEKKEDKK